MGSSMGGVAVAKLVLTLAYLVSTAAAGMYCVIFPAFLLIRPFSKALCLRLVRLYIGAWWFTTLIITERLNPVRVRITGATEEALSCRRHSLVPTLSQLPPADVPLLIMANHKCNLDWVYLWSIAVRINRRQIGYFAAIAKNVLRKIPIFGWAFKLIGFLFLSRSFEVDEPRIVKWAQALIRVRSEPLWLVLYPEGTRYTEKGRLRSADAAKKMGVEPPKGELLLPRTKGFVLLMKLLRGYFHSVMDMTIAYVGPENKLLSWKELGTNALVETLAGKLPVERVHIHITLFPTASLPEEAEKLDKWVMQRWREKETMLGHLERTGNFPSAQNEALESPPPPLLGQSLVAASFVLLSLGMTWLFVSYWHFRMYVLLMTAAMTVIAHIDPPGWP